MLELKDVFVDPQRAEKLFEKIENEGINKFGLFIGSGLSSFYGLPDWKGLIKKLAEKVGIEEIVNNLDFLIAGEILKEGLGEDFHDALWNVLKGTVPTEDRDIYGIIANTKINRLVTTNFDDHLEIAFRKENLTLSY
jgi:hypothetical protein